MSKYDNQKVMLDGEAFDTLSLLTRLSSFDAIKDIRMRTNLDDEDCRLLVFTYLLTRSAKVTSTILYDSFLGMKSYEDCEILVSSVESYVRSYK